MAALHHLAVERQARRARPGGMLGLGCELFGSRGSLFCVNRVLLGHLFDLIEPLSNLGYAQGLSLTPTRTMLIMKWLIGF